MPCAPSEATNQSAHPGSPIRLFTVHMRKNHWVLSYPYSAQRRLLSDWADAQADLNLRIAHMSFCLICHASAQLYQMT